MKDGLFYLFLDYRTASQVLTKSTTLDIAYSVFLFPCSSVIANDFLNNLFKSVYN